MSLKNKQASLQTPLKSKEGQLLWEATVVEGKQEKTTSGKDRTKGQISPAPDNSSKNKRQPHLNRMYVDEAPTQEIIESGYKAMISMLVNDYLNQEVKQ